MRIIVEVRIARSNRASRLLTALGLVLFAAPMVQAQITYDAGQNAYFVTGNATINTDTGNNDVVVGRAPNGDPVLSLHRLTVSSGANITGYDDTDPENSNPNHFNRGLTLFDNAYLTVDGGSVGVINGEGTGTIDVNGGSVGSIFNEGIGDINVNGGAIGTIFSSTADVQIRGGSVGSVIGELQNSINISGGSVTHMAVPGLGALRLSGGNLGGIDPNVTDSTPIGIYYYTPGDLNLYGSFFARSNPLAGSYSGISGTYWNLTGVLLDGNLLNTTLFVADGLDVATGNCGGTQFQPLLGQADSGNSGSHAFGLVPTGAWFDPPLVGAYDFQMTDGNLFTDILDFPVGIGDADGLFSVSVNGTVLGQFGPGSGGVHFEDFGYLGGVSSFTIFGIDPTVDAADPAAFPVQLAFNAPFASFTMTGAALVAAPESSTLALLGVALPLAGVALRRRRG